MTTNLRHHTAPQRRRRTAGLIAGATIALALVAAPAHATTTSFAFAGAEQTFTVPAGVTRVHVTAIGSRGGNGTFDADVRGQGALVTGTIPATPGQTLYIEVGGYTANGAGFNGGGAPRGGGATDVRTKPAALGLASLQSRRIIAAGGGGNADFLGGDAGSAGAGDGAGQPGTRDGPGAAIYGRGGTPGVLGSGGAGAGSMYENRGGGGGGGFYGGGGGGYSSYYDQPAGGGGGSSLVPPGGTQALASVADFPRVDLTYAPASNTTPASHPVIALFTSSPRSLRVSKTGRFTYRFLATPGRNGTAKLTSTKKVKVGSKKRKIKLAAKTFSAPANAQVRLKFKLSSKSLKALKRKGSVKFKVTVAIGAKSFTATLKLKAPKTG